MRSTTATPTACCGWPASPSCVGGVSLFIGYTAAQVAHAQEVKEAIDAGEI